MYLGLVWLRCTFVIVADCKAVVTTYMYMQIGDCRIASVGDELIL